MTTATKPPTVKAEEKSRNVVETAREQVRTSLLAALGAGNLATHAVVDAVNKAKDKVVETGETARKNIEEIPHDVEGLREKLDPSELRKVVDEYTEAALKLYNKLAESGEEAWDKFTAQPQVKKAIEQVEDALSAAQDRVEGATHDARERVDSVLGLVSKRTRSVGEKTARMVSEVADEAADAIEEAGDEIASETRSVTRKAANKTAPQKTTVSARRTTTSPAAKKPAAPKTEK